MLFFLGIKKELSEEMYFFVGVLFVACISITIFDHFWTCLTEFIFLMNLCDMHYYLKHLAKTNLNFFFLSWSKW